MDYFKECVKDLSIPKSWVNTWYGNDACPSYHYKGYHIFTDHANPEEREVEGHRFSIFLELEYGECDKWYFSSDDLEEIKKEIEVSIFDRPMLYEKEDYTEQLKRMGE